MMLKAKVLGTQMCSLLIICVTHTYVYGMNRTEVVADKYAAVEIDWQFLSPVTTHWCELC